MRWGFLLKTAFRGVEGEDVCPSSKFFEVVGADLLLVAARSAPFFFVQKKRKGYYSVRSSGTWL